MTFADPLVLRTDRADGLSALTLNRAVQFNSLSQDILTALQAELDLITADEAVRVVGAHCRRLPVGLDVPPGGGSGRGEILRLGHRVAPA